MVWRCCWAAVPLTVGNPITARRRLRPWTSGFGRQRPILLLNGSVCTYLNHNGVVRGTARARVRDGDQDAAPVSGMVFSYDQEKVDDAVSDTYKLPGVYYVRIWLNEGELSVGEDIMYVLIGGDIRPHVLEGLQYLVGRIKNEYVVEKELVHKKGRNCDKTIAKGS